MLFLLSLLAIIYFVNVSKLRSNYVKAIKEKEKKNFNYVDEKIIYKASFSNKPSSLFAFTTVVTLTLIGLLVMYNIAGNEVASDYLDISELSCKLLAGISFFAMLYTGGMSLLYGWADLITANEFLIITDKKVIGTSCKIDGFRTYYTNFEINISQVTDTITQKQEKSAGIDMSTFSILTDTDKYDLALLNDSSEIRNIISRRTSNNF